MGYKDPEKQRIAVREAARRRREREKLAKLAGPAEVNKVKAQLALVPKRVELEQITRESWQREILECGIAYFRQCCPMEAGHVKSEGLKTAMAMVESVNHLLPSAAVAQEEKSASTRACMADPEYRREAIRLAQRRSQIASGQ